MTSTRSRRMRVISRSAPATFALTQSALSLIEERSRGDDEEFERAWALRTCFLASRASWGSAPRGAWRRRRGASEAFGTEFNASFLVGGQIAGERTCLFHVYAAGNFIEATPETPSSSSARDQVTANRSSIAC